MLASYLPKEQLDPWSFEVAVAVAESVAVAGSVAVAVPVPVTGSDAVTGTGMPVSKCRQKQESSISGEGGMHCALRALLASQGPWSSLQCSTTTLNIAVRLEPSVQLPVHMIS